MPAILTIVTEDDLLDFVSDQADTETRETVEAAAATDARVRHVLGCIEQVDCALRELSGDPSTTR